MRLILRRFLTSVSITLSAPWEMEKLWNLGYWDFVYHVYYRGEPEPPPQAKSHSTDCPRLPPAVSGSPSTLMTHKRRRSKNGPAVAPLEAARRCCTAPEAVMPPFCSRRRKSKASSIPHGLEAIPELTADPEAFPKLFLLTVLPINQGSCSAGASLVRPSRTSAGSPELA